MSRPYLGVLFAAFFLATGFVSMPLSAQADLEMEAADPPASLVTSSTIDETTIIIGETLAAPASTGGSSVFVMLRMILVLAMAALAIYGVVFFIKRLTRPQESRDPHLKILARVPLSSDSFAAVISLGAKAWLVAGSSGTVNLISEVDEKEPLEAMLLEDSRRVAETGQLNFGSLLRRFGAPAEGQSGQPEGGSFADRLRRQRDRLRRL